MSNKTLVGVSIINTLFVSGVVSLILYLYGRIMANQESIEANQITIMQLIHDVSDLTKELKKQK